MSNLQRQTIVDSLTRLATNGSLTQHGRLCRSGRNRSAVRTSATTSSKISSSVISRQQKRYFAASMVNCVKSKEPDDVASYSNKSNKSKGKKPLKRDQDVDADQISSSSSKKTLDSLDPVVNGKPENSNRSSAIVIAEDEFTRDKARTSKHGYSMTLKNMLRDFPAERDLKKMASLDEKVDALKNHIDNFYSTWQSTLKEDCKHHKINIHYELASRLAQSGDLCRQVRTDERYASLQSLAGQYLHEVINYINERIKQEDMIDNDGKYLLECLRIQAFSLEMKPTEARRLIDSLFKYEEDWLSAIEEVEELVIRRDLRRNSHPRLQALADALASVLQIPLNLSSKDTRKERKQLGMETLDWLLEQPNRFRFNNVTFSNLLFRFNLLIGFLDDHIDYIKTRRERLDEQQTSLLASSICRTLIRNDLVLETYNTYRWTQRNGIDLEESVLRQLLRLATLLKEDIFAGKLVDDMLGDARTGDKVLELSTCRAMASSCARRGEEKKMEEILRTISDQYDQTEEAEDLFAYQIRLSYHINVGNVDRVVKLVEGRYDMRIAPGQIPEVGLLYPDFQMHLNFIQVYLKAHKKDQAELMLHRMVQFGHRPTIHVINAILHYYVQNNDVSNTLSLYRQLVNSDLNANLQTYTSLIALFAKKKDVESASKVMMAMQKKGIQPDRIAYTALLNAHVEAGSWQGAIEVFSWMLQNGRRNLRHLLPSTHAYNTMLKAHVLQSIPVQDTFEFFKNMIDAGMEPDQHSFALILQAVADAGFMDLAEQIFSSIEDRLGGFYGTEVGKGAGIWHFTIMIQGYLRIKQLDSARGYANELRERGYTATGVLWSVLVKAYIARDEADNLESSVKLVQTASFDDPSAYAGAYQPLISAFSKRAEVNQVEKLLNEVTEKGAEVPFYFWVTLLDGLRRGNNLSGALELWNMIFDKALEQVKFSDIEVTKPIAEQEKNLDMLPKSHKSNVLCLPLSIIIDILAQHGQYERLAQEWLRCRKAGFAFDSHNWNHLCHAFLKAGRLRDSLNIIAQVLNKYPPNHEWREYALRAREASAINAKYGDKRPEDVQSTANILFDASEGEKTIEPSRPPNRRHQTRVLDDLYATYPLGKDDDKRSKEKQNLSFYYSQGQEKKRQQAYGEAHQDDSTILKHLETQLRLDEKFSPWYAHFETMLQLNEVLKDIDKSGGVVRLEDNTVLSVEELMERYPRVEALLGRFRNKMEEIQEIARANVSRAQQRRRGAN